MSFTTQQEKKNLTAIVCETSTNYPKSSKIALLCSTIIEQNNLEGPFYIMMEDLDAVAMKNVCNRK